jgi:hypothetical protein
MPPAPRRSAMTIPTPKLIAPGESRTVQLYGVKFDYKVEGAHSGGTLAKPHNHTREVEELERTYGVKL